MKSLSIFFLSVLAAVLMLLVERTAGIGWDFHPDAVTYATLSEDNVSLILSQSYWLILNNAYYFWAALLGMDVRLMTLANVLLFAFTNVLLYRFHQRHALLDSDGILWILAVGLLILNPYRLHLATTVLKDTMIIALVVIAATGRLATGLLVLPFLMLLRVISPVYMTVYMRRRQLIWTMALGLLVIAVFSDALTSRLLDFNAADMQLREFDRVPNFRDYGIVGVVLRAAVWPLLGVTGLFAVISPAPAFIPVALGALMNQLYCRIVVGRFTVPLSVFVPMAIFGSIVTGYTPYIRYVYPLLVVLPLVALRDFREKNRRHHATTDQYAPQPA